LEALRGLTLPWQFEEEQEPVPTYLSGVAEAMAGNKSAAIKSRLTCLGNIAPSTAKCCIPETGAVFKQQREARHRKRVKLSRLLKFASVHRLLICLDRLRNLYSRRSVVQFHAELIGSSCWLSAPDVAAL
jgi:hypothetical protein